MHRGVRNEVYEVFPLSHGLVPRAITLLACDEISPYKYHMLCKGFYNCERVQDLWMCYDIYLNLMITEWPDCCWLFSMAGGDRACVVPITGVCN